MDFGFGRSQLCTPGSCGHLHEGLHCVLLDWMARDQKKAFFTKTPVLIPHHLRSDLLQE